MAALLFSSAGQVALQMSPLPEIVQAQDIAQSTPDEVPRLGPLISSTQGVCLSISIKDQCKI